MEVVLGEIATHIPDLVIQRPHNAPLPQTIHSYGVIVFADVTDFTKLCERYCSAAKSKVNGTDKLSTILNTYLSQIVQCILEAGGDILKFAGDAILAFWSCSQFTAETVLNEVIQTSMNIQANFDNFKTQDDTRMRMKIGLSIGRVELHFIGNSSYRTFDVTGQAIEDANSAQIHTNPGSVVVSKLAWKMCDQLNYSGTPLMTGHVEVNYLVKESSAENIKSQSKDPAVDVVLKSAVVPISWRRRSSRSSRRSSRSTSSTVLNYRPKASKLLPLLDSEAQEVLRTYIPLTVRHKIDHGHEVTWLSELREVSVLFINLNPEGTLDSDATLDLLKDSFDILQPSLSKYGGSLNKLFMFDKGCTFLCIFGLPHVPPREDICSDALSAAREIFNNLDHLRLNSHYSIGITTGIAFCGVVGHPQRHEYTVIGEKVNMAARLMMKFPGTITCDETTKTKSFLSADQFTLTPQVTLKGITNPENVYNFSPEHIESSHKHSWDAKTASDAEELIGRHKEMEVFLEELVYVSEHTSQDTGVLLISGTGGMGKTKLLRAMKAKAAAMDFRVVSGMGGLVEQNTPFYTVKTIVSKLLKIDECKNIHEREELLLEHITDFNMRQLLPLLNDLLILKFPQTHTTSNMVDYRQRSEGLHKLLQNIVHQEALSKPCVFGIDDAHWVDADSWMFLLNLTRQPNALLVLTMRPPQSIENKPAAMTEILESPLTKVLILEGLSPENMVSLACQLLRVENLPEELQQIITKRSHGVPLWCVELVDSMLELEYLNKASEETSTEAAVSLQTKDGSSEHQCYSDASGEDTVQSEEQTAKKESEPPVAGLNKPSTGPIQVLSGIKLKDIPIPDSVAGMVLSRVDHLSAPEQMTLKCAAIAGTVFRRTMLQAIIPKCDPKSFHKSLNTLAEAGIIKCAIAAKRANKDSDYQLSRNHHCPCLEEKTSSLQLKTTRYWHITHPPVDNCEILCFVHNYFQEIAYSLWTESQRKALHQAAAQFLELQAHQCEFCGGGKFIAENIIAMRKISGRIADSRSNVCLKPRRNYTTTSPSDEAIEDITMSRDREESVVADEICLRNVLPDVERDSCYCNEVLAIIYPQLVRHWRAAGDYHNTALYLIETASAAIVTSNNMEALSLLQEAKNIITDAEKCITLSSHQRGRLESLTGQALCQMGQIDESMPHFHSALELLSSRLPRSFAAGTCALLYQCFKQFLHSRFPSRFHAHMQGSEPFLDTERCLSLVSHIYRHQNRDMMSLMAALKHLNAAEAARNYYSSELLEAYTSMIEHCQHLNFRKIAKHYFKKATVYCDSIDFGHQGLHAYAHFLSVGLNFQLYQGNVKEAISVGTAGHEVTQKIHDVSTEMSVLLLLFFAHTANLDRTDICDILKAMSEIAIEDDDLRARAVYDCCHFDALLGFGMDWYNEPNIVARAEASCIENVYYFDQVERFFLISCLALWHARKGNYVFAKKYSVVARGLQPIQFESCSSVKAQSRYTEACLLLMHNSFTRRAVTQAHQALKKLKLGSCKFRIFQARYLFFKAYFKLLQNRSRRARNLVEKAIFKAEIYGNHYDAEWCQRSKRSWFQHTNENTDIDDSDTIYMFVLPT